MISYESLSRARTTLSDFTRFYFPLHGLSADDFFRWSPLLVYVEACIYQLDEENEDHCRTMTTADDAPDRSSGVRGGPGSTATEIGLYGVLRSHGLLSDAVYDELQNGYTYWDLERRLCSSMAKRESVSLDEVFCASALKSFDYRVLHLLLCALSGSTASEELLSFLRVDEVLTDIADDLFDYEKDCRKNSFNVLRGAVHACRERGGLVLAEKIGELEKEHESLLQALPAATRDVYCRNRSAAMARPGSEKWVFPETMQPEEERQYRAAEAAQRESVRRQRQQVTRARGDAGKGGIWDEVESEIESDAEPLPCKRRDVQQLQQGCSADGCEYSCEKRARRVC